jgi:hypothetical protein
VTQGPDGTRARLKRRLQRTSQCIPLDQFENELHESEQDHLASCTRCQSEFALWQALRDTAEADDDESVNRVAAELARRLPWKRPTQVGAGYRGKRPHARAVLAAAATVLAAAVGYVMWDPEPGVENAATVEHEYRSAGIRVLSPAEELDRAPDELTWQPVSGDVRYDVRVLEVDGTLLWSTLSVTPGVRLPPAVLAEFVPGKTIVWDVTARNSAGVAVAHSGTHRVRVRVLSPPRRQ